MGRRLLLWDTCGVIDKIGVKSALFDLVIGQIPCQLVNDRSDHLQMPQFFCADIRQQSL